MALVVKNPTDNAGYVRDGGLIPGSGKSPAGGHGNPLQDSCLENPHGQRALEGYSPGGHKESDTTEVTWHTRMQKENQKNKGRQEKEKLLTFPVCLEFLSTSPRQQVFISGASPHSTSQLFLKTSQTSLINPLPVRASSGISESLLCRTFPPNFQFSGTTTFTLSYLSVPFLIFFFWFSITNLIYVQYVLLSR